MLPTCVSLTSSCFPYASPVPHIPFTQLSVADLEVLSAGITALGGQWRTGLTRDVTHLFALRTGSDKVPTSPPHPLRIPLLPRCPVQHCPSLCTPNPHVHHHPTLVRRRRPSRSSYPRNTLRLARPTRLAPRYDPQPRRRSPHCRW